MHVSFLSCVLQVLPISSLFQSPWENLVKLLGLWNCCIIDWIWWGETMSQNGPIVHPPGDIWTDNHSGDDAEWGYLHQSSQAVLPAETSGEIKRNGRRSENFAYQYLKYLKGSLTCRKILRRGIWNCCTSLFVADIRSIILWHIGFSLVTWPMHPVAFP
jgi:hypothetical protein